MNHRDCFVHSVNIVLRRLAPFASVQQMWRVCFCHAHLCLTVLQLTDFGRRHSRSDCSVRLCAWTKGVKLVQVGSINATLIGVCLYPWLLSTNQSRVVNVYRAWNVCSVSMKEGVRNYVFSLHITSVLISSTIFFKCPAKSNQFKDVETFKQDSIQEFFCHLLRM